MGWGEGRCNVVCHPEGNNISMPAADAFWIASSSSSSSSCSGGWWGAGRWGGMGKGGGRCGVSVHGNLVYRLQGDNTFITCYCLLLWIASSLPVLFAFICAVMSFLLMLPVLLMLTLLMLSVLLMFLLLYVW